MVKQLVLLSLLAASLVAGCSDSPSLPPQWQTYRFSGACVSPMWGVSSSELWIGGYGYDGLEDPKPFLWSFDGAAWSEQLVDETNYLIISMWGFAGDDVFAAGGGWSWWTEESWPAVFHFDGATWSEMELPDESGYLSAIWGSAPDNVIAAYNLWGDHVQLLRFDGSSWAPMAAQLPSDTRFVVKDIWGSSANDVHAVGLRIENDQWVGIAARFDGASWSYVDMPGSARPEGIWGLGPATVFAVGKKGLIMKYDGTGWSAMDSGTDRTLNAVWGRAADDVYAVGDGEGGVCTALHYDGAAWSQLPVDCSEWAKNIGHHLTGVWGTAAGDLYLSGYLPPSGVPHCVGSFVLHLPAG